MMRRRSAPTAWAALALWMAAVPVGVATLRASVEERLPLSSSLRIVSLNGRALALEARASAYRNDAHLGERLLREGAAIRPEQRIRRADPGGGSTETWVRIPLQQLADPMRGLVLRTVFPEDRIEGDAWVHVARAGRLPTFDEGLWQVAEWFTGDGAAFSDLMTANSLQSPELRAGQVVRIPLERLHPALRPRLASDDGLLEFGADDDGPYGGYRLRAGESLYSAVVQRFTGRTASEDVNALAAQLCERSGIDDLRDIPVGFEVRIPLDVLEPRYLPPTHPRRLEAEQRARELQAELQARPPASARRGLDDVLVILDPGHGGRDLGTMKNGIWEHDYVYDVACRLKRSLENRTSARVVMTLVDEETGCNPSSGDKLTANRQGTIQTRPPFLAREIDEHRIAVNLRWYLANSIYRKEIARGTDPDKIVFLSLHADARHPSLSGVMVYVPGADYRTRTYGHTAAVYTRRAEVAEKPTIRFSKQDRVRSEAVSRAFADRVVDAFRAHGLPVHAHQPIRHRIIRDKQRFVPAVLRGNAVPHKVLVEMVNLSNRDDARLIGSAAKRETLADALFDSLLAHYGDEALRAEAARTTSR